jgi:hypothetical protein
MPIPFLKENFANFYRASATKFLSTIRETGFVQYKKVKGKYDSEIVLGNKKLLDKHNATQMIHAPLNVRHVAYLPTILIVSLILASPVSRARIAIALPIGFISTLGVILLNTRIRLIYLCETTPWLQLSQYSDANKARLEFIYLNFVNYGAPALILVVAIWLIVTFRKSDLLPLNK